MNITIKFFPTIICQIPDHIRVTRSLLGDTGTVTFTFNNLKFLMDKLNNIHCLYQLEIRTDQHIYSTRDIRILWANGKPCVLQAVFFIHNRELFDYFFQNLQAFAFDKGLSFFQNEEYIENLGN
uniref:Photosystem II reaction center Psb28 protein n=1 Tax=Eustigmatophyceae sp. Mont 10/10-1w TaxID=2506145 RepID=A0A3R5QLZ7_9STRA|nr:photosystem II protein psb28 [Eustigmatophyceae sp. Mont 10/10-1w]QAA11754.1 photosystem II protein psb28 [Eustigmatophyceae sp. Mont 10/10-1w]